MALPFLPVEHIEEAFRQMTASSTTVDERLTGLITYVADTWVSSRLWSPKAWSAYRCSVRTNNDVEGWHNRLNRKTRRGHLDIYQLASLLFSEAQFVDVQARLVSEARLCRYQKKTYTRVQGRLASYWTQYESGQLSTSALLRKCCRVYGPVD